MPVPLRTTYQKAEAKYNVTTEFPSLGLHHAAATGNVGLAGYALDHGQPINSVLDGVLPLHAACAGGNIQVVKLLIDHGADVNAPRLPRRYSNEKIRDTSVPIVGTSGSTPLHFAAANGNTSVVTLLLLHGAHANRPDKHGITPEMLAKQNGWLECAEVLKQWLVNKDRDLRERPGGSLDDASGFGPDNSSNRERSGSLNIDGKPSSFVPGRRRIHVKQSIDTALNLLKSSSTDLRPQFLSYNSSLLTPPASPSKALADEDSFSRIAPPDSPFTSSDSSLSPILSNDPQGASLVDKTEFPFSINTPPPVYSEETEGAGNQELLQVPPRPGSSRNRGNSVSSISTSDSRHNPSLSASGTTSGSGGSDTINTPWFSSPGREAFLQMPADSSVRYTEGLTPEDVRDQASPYRKPRNLNGTAIPLHERRHNIPPDINISSISTHAQAEALVQRVQQDILEMAPAELSSGASSNGRSPLSARLAAYGESLALERRFREQRGIDQASLLSSGVGSTPPSTTGLTEPMPVGDSSRQNGVERQHSLDHRHRPRFKSRMPTRPSTAEGVSPRLGDKPFGDFAARFHHSPRSASGTSPPSRLAIEQDLSLLDDAYRGPGISPSFSTTLHDSRLADGRLSHTNGGSSESVDADTELGPSIYRTSTTPLGPSRGSKATATKLTKMGFPSTEQARNPPPKRFGAIRSLVQTLKGKP